jgi:hypothetical protein
MKVVMRAWWAIVGLWEKRREGSWNGSGKFGALAAMVRRRASTCFAFMLPKNQVGAVDLFAGTEGDTARGVSNKGQESRLSLFLAIASYNPNPK